jgi:hypothetical protein
MDFGEPTTRHPGGDAAQNTTHPGTQVTIR